MALSEKEELELLELEEAEYQDSLKSKQPEAPAKMSFGEGLGRGALAALPIAGGIAGGIAGAVGGPLGVAGGAAAGSMAGKSAEQLGKALFYDERPESTGAALKEVGAEGLYGLAGEGAGKLVSMAAKPIVQAAKSIGPKIGHALTGVSEQEIKTYAKRADQIKQLAKSSDSNIAEAADQVRQTISKKLKDAKDVLNSTIESTLQNFQNKVKIQPILDEITLMKSKINAELYPEQIAQIDDIAERVSKVAKGTDEVSLSELNQIKRFLQEKGSSAYAKPGDMFAVGPEAASAARNAGAKARELLNTAAPAIKDANNKFARLHDIDDTLNQNILREGKPEASLLAAGSGTNQRNAGLLEDLGKEINYDVLGEAQNLAAMRTFNNAPIMPVDTTGKSAARMGLSAGVGALFGGPAGAVVGSAMSSPMTLKAGMDIGRGLSKLPIKEAASFGARSAVQASDKFVNKDEIMSRVKGSPYEQAVRNAYNNGGDKSLAAVNYVLKHRDENYRKLFEGEGK